MNRPRPDEKWSYVTLSFKDNNNTMIMTLTPEGKERIKEEGYLRDRDKWNPFCTAVRDFLEELFCNGWKDCMVDAGDDLALSDDYHYDDTSEKEADEPTINSSYVYDGTYSLSLQELYDKGSIELKLNECI